ncbi:MAG: hypothetical protein U1E62_06645 [Alsobacter sp.]
MISQQQTILHEMQFHGGRLIVPWFLSDDETIRELVATNLIAPVPAHSPDETVAFELTDEGRRQWATVRVPIH